MTITLFKHRHTTLSDTLRNLHISVLLQVSKKKSRDRVMKKKSNKKKERKKKKHEKK